MAFTSAETKIVLAYNNKVTTANVTAVTIASATPDASYPIANLKYEDPWRMLKVPTTPSGNPVIKIQFTAAQTINCFGLVNHNLWSSANYTIELAYSSDDTSYTVVGSTSLVSDGNLLLRFTTSPARVWWRITLTASPRAAFYLGAVFLGTYSAMASNPIDGGVNTRLGVPVDFIESAGDAKHVRFGASKFTTQAELTWERATQATVLALVETIARPNMRKMIGIITPEQVNVIVPLYAEHLFGYLTSAVVAPREGASSSTHRADVVLNIEGVM